MFPLHPECNQIREHESLKFDRNNVLKRPSLAVETRWENHGGDDVLSALSFKIPVSPTMSGDSSQNPSEICVILRKVRNTSNV